MSVLLRFTRPLVLRTLAVIALLGVPGLSHAQYSSRPVGAPSVRVGNPGGNTNIGDVNITGLFTFNGSPIVTGQLVGTNNPSLCMVGAPCRLGHLTGANLNVTTDQAIVIGIMTPGSTGYLPAATKYKLTEIMVGNCSASTTTAQGGFYTAVSKGGTIIGAATTPYTTCASATTLTALKAVTNMDTTILTAATLYLSLTTAQGGADTADIDIYGIPYN